MGKEIVTQVRETQIVPNRINSKWNTPRHILIKLTKIKHKEQILKAAREKQQIKHKGMSVKKKVSCYHYGNPLVCCCFSLAAFNICSLCLIFVNLINMCFGLFSLGFILFGTLGFWTWEAISFPILGKFSTIISSNIFYGLSFCLLLGLLWFGCWGI